MWNFTCGSSFRTAACRDMPADPGALTAECYVCKLPYPHQPKLVISLKLFFYLLSFKACIVSSYAHISYFINRLASCRPMILFVSKAKLWTHFVVSLVQLYWYCNGRFINKSNRFAVNQSHSQASDYSMSALSCFLPRQCCQNDSCCMQHDWLECWLQAWPLQMVHCCRCFRTLYFAFL